MANKKKNLSRGTTDASPQYHKEGVHTSIQGLPGFETLYVKRGNKGSRWGSSLGFSLGESIVEKNNLKFHYVNLVAHGSPAQTSGFLSGDLILRVGDHNFINIDHENAISAIMSAPHSFEVDVIRPHQETRSNSETDVYGIISMSILSRDANPLIGIEWSVAYVNTPLANYKCTFIDSVTSLSQGENAGLIARDILLELNGELLLGKSYNEVANAFQNTQKKCHMENIPISLTVYRQPKRLDILNAFYGDNDITYKLITLIGSTGVLTISSRQYSKLFGNGDTFSPTLLDMAPQTLVIRLSNGKEMYFEDQDECKIFGLSSFFSKHTITIKSFTGDSVTLDHVTEETDLACAAIEKMPTLGFAEDFEVVCASNNNLIFKTGKEIAAFRGRMSDGMRCTRCVIRKRNDLRWVPLVLSDDISSCYPGLKPTIDINVEGSISYVSCKIKWTLDNYVNKISGTRNAPVDIDVFVKTLQDGFGLLVYRYPYFKSDYLLSNAIFFKRHAITVESINGESIILNNITEDTELATALEEQWPTPIFVEEITLVSAKDSSIAFVTGQDIMTFQEGNNALLTRCILIKKDLSKIPLSLSDRLSTFKLNNIELSIEGNLGYMRRKLAEELNEKPNFNFSARSIGVAIRDRKLPSSHDARSLSSLGINSNSTVEIFVKQSW
eukprot:UC4_evm2s27